MTNKSFSSTIDYAALGERFRAYRLGAQLTAEEIAERLGVSRSIVYRMEKGDFVKIETIERVALLLGTSLPSLLGVEVEYYGSALAFVERLRQLEEGTNRIMAHFEPISLLLVSEEYFDFLRLMFHEIHGETTPFIQREKEIEALILVLKERKELFERRRPNMISLVGLRNLERFLHTGLVGSLSLPKEIRLARREAASRELLRIAKLMEEDPMYVQIGLVDDAMPASTFQLLVGERSSVLATSPFRFGELPNLKNGIATVTASQEAVALHEKMIAKLWGSAYKGKSGAERLYRMLDNF